MDIAKVHREMREHPERFDYGDLPEPGLTPAQNEQADEMRPEWLKKMQDDAKHN